MRSAVARRVFVDPALEAAVDRDGFAVIDFLDERETSALRAWWEANDAPTKRGGFAASVLIDDAAYRSAVFDAIADVFAERQLALLDGYRFTGGNFLVKNPGHDHGEVPLHQDPSFVDERRYTSIGFWVPLTDVDTTNGCLHVIAGSHRLNPVFRAANDGFAYEELAPQLRDKLTPIPMRAGRAFVFRQSVFHASLPNRGGEVRVAAAGIALPREAPLWYVYASDGAPNRKEVFVVHDAFYREHRYATRPVGLEPIAVFDAPPLQLDPARVDAVLAAGRDYRRSPGTMTSSE